MESHSSPAIPFHLLRTLPIVSVSGKMILSQAVPSALSVAALIAVQITPVIIHGAL